jgi:hypothetical protein
MALRFNLHQVQRLKELKRDENGRVHGALLSVMAVGMVLLGTDSFNQIQAGNVFEGAMSAGGAAIIVIAGLRGLRRD